MAVRVTLFALSLIAITGDAIAAGTPGDATRDELIATTQALMDAITDGKADLWQRTLTDDAVIVDEFGRIQTKAEFVPGVTGLPPGLSGRIEVRNPVVRVNGDTAVLVANADEYETVFGQQLHVLYRFTNTFVRRDGQWRLMAMHDVTVPTTPPALAVADMPWGDYPGVYRYGPQRTFTVTRDGDALSFNTKPGRPPTKLLPVARDVFMDDGDEKNLFVFQRDGKGQVDRLIERRKFNDLVMRREAAQH
ncbi:MAG TPA: nuclear transport factor 2 family protein [Lysobacter sp.]|jgi:ketosteroid isomerase-like protein|nr:nuclear transport factor 2 family protein [Lysobacter sp.]